MNASPVVCWLLQVDLSVSGGLGNNRLELHTECPSPPEFLICIFLILSGLLRIRKCSMPCVATQRHA